MSKWIDIEKAIEDLQNGDPSQLYDVEDIKCWLNCLPSAQPEGRSGVFIPDITVKNLRKAPLEAVEELLVVGEMEDIVLPSAQPEPHWIPCSERLPELDDEVLVTDDGGELRHCIFCTLGEIWCGFITYEEGMRIIATAWMPLPPVYRGDEK